MTVLMFQPRFSALVESGQKVQTIRPPRKRLPKPLEILSLRQWTGKPYRSKQRELKREFCVRTAPIQIQRAFPVVRIWRENAWHPVVKVNEFAVRDGFRDIADMVDWFDGTHGLPFEGVLISWDLEGRPL